MLPGPLKEISGTERISNCFHSVLPASSELLRQSYYTFDFMFGFHSKRYLTDFVNVAASSAVLSLLNAEPSDLRAFLPSCYSDPHDTSITGDLPSERKSLVLFALPSTPR